MSGAATPRCHGRPTGTTAADAGRQTGRPVARRPLHARGLHSDRTGVEPARSLLHRAERAGPVGGQPGPVRGPIRAHLPGGARRPVRESAGGPTDRASSPCSSSTPRRWAPIPGASGAPTWWPDSWPPSRRPDPTPVSSAPRPRSLRSRPAATSRGWRWPPWPPPGSRDRARWVTAIGWLVAEQCPDGGWTSPDNAVNACSGIAGDLQRAGHQLDGPGRRGPRRPGGRHPGPGRPVPSPSSASGQDADGGWSYYPNTVATPGSTDPDSTALVIQSLIALGSTPTGAASPRPRPRRRPRRCRRSCPSG